MAGKLYFWGSNDPYLTGTTGSPSIIQEPSVLNADEDWEDISSAFQYFIAVKDGKLYGWGSHNNIEGTYSTPTHIFTDHDNFKSVTTSGATYDAQVLAIKKDGTLWAWGYNENGATGLGTTSGYTAEPTQVGNSSNWKKVKTFNDVSIALKNDGTIWSWGWRAYGATGQGSPTTGTISVPTKIGTGSNWHDFSLGGGFTHVIAVKTDGTLWSWGSNHYYQTGRNSATPSSYTNATISPTQIGSENDWLNPTSYGSAGFCTKEDGTLWSWGRNWGYINAQSPGGETDYTINPTQVGTLNNWWKVLDNGGGSAGSGVSYGATYAVQKDQSLWSWGNNQVYQTGQGTDSGYTQIPAKVDNLNHYSEKNYYLGDFGGARIYNITGALPIPPTIEDTKVFNPSKDPKVGDQLSANFKQTGTGTVSYQWKRKKPEDSEWVNIPGATDPTYIIGEDDIGYEIIVEITIENEYGSDIQVSPSTGAVIQTFSTESWRFLFHEINGDTIGEFTDLHNVRLEVGLNKNPSLSFNTTLQSNLGKLLADSLSETDPVMLVSAWRYDPYNEVYKVQFSGPIFTLEETGSDDNPSIGVTAVGSYYRLSKRIANDEDNRGRRQSGLSPTLDTLQLLVTDNANNRIMVFDAKTGAYITKWGSAGSGDGQFDNPFGIAVGPDNYVYVADTDNNRIQKFSLDGTYVSQWNEVEDGDNLLSYPIDVAVDQSSGDVWVADRGNKQVVKYDKDGNYLFKVEPVTGCPMDNLRGISVDYEGTVYISDQTDLTTNPNNQGVYKITPTGQIIVETTGIINSYQKKFAIDNAKQTYWVNGAGQLRKSPGRPKLTSKASTMQTSSIGQSVVVGSDKAIYFLESNNTDTSRVKKYNPANNSTKTIGTYGTGNGETQNAKGIALARSGSRDAIEIIDEIITDSNDRDGHSWINPADTQGTTQKIFIQPGSLGGFRSISSIIEEFNQYYEWRLIPKFEEDGGDLILGEWYADAVLGENKATDGSVIFEYGFGKLNVDSYTIKKSIEGLANRINYPAADQNPYNISSISPDSISAIGLFEDSISGNVLDTDLRKQVTDLHLFYRVYPRMLVEIQPTRSDQSGPNNTRVPIPLIEYLPGDFIGLEIQDQGDQRIPAAEARIYDMTVEIDDEGRETCSLNLYLEGS